MHLGGNCPCQSAGVASCVWHSQTTAQSEFSKMDQAAFLCKSSKAGWNSSCEASRHVDWSLSNDCKLTCIQLPREVSIILAVISLNMHDTRQHVGAAC